MANLLKIAIAQLNPTVGDLSGNRKRILQYAQKAHELGAQLMVTPELAICGYPPRDLLVRPGFIKAIATELTILARELPPELKVLVGAAMTSVDAKLDHPADSLVNAAVLLSEGILSEIYPKQLLPTYDVFDEDRYFMPGVRPNVMEVDGVKVGVTICEDIWNDEEFWGRRSYHADPVADLIQAKAELMVNLSASPYVAGKQRLREEMIQHCAQRHGISLVYVNQVGGNDDLVFDGTSLAVNASGKVVRRTPGFEAGLAIADYDPTTREFQPDSMPVVGRWESSVAMVGEDAGVPVQQTGVAELASSIDGEIWAALVLGVRDYARKCGFSKVLLGLSGGIDSAVVAAIAAAALGPKSVLGVLMPSPYSSDHSIGDAEALAKNLGIATETLPIGDLMGGYDRTFETLFSGTEAGVTEENLQSRIRGNLLMAIANKFGHLLLTTGNKSEIAVGYCTLYGDMNGGLAVIADVPKTRVYSLCRWLNRGQKGCPDHAKLATVPDADNPLEIIPDHILTKPPSAELRPGQVDQDSLPDYDVLDDILDRLVHQAQAPSELIAAGHDPDTVDRIIRLLSRAEFKRRQAAPGIKVTERAFGTGWRMPIASRWQLQSTH
ncbi:MAG: NAD+ synthase [Cyanobacteria bacterium P01_D01_bin.73]